MDKTPILSLVNKETGEVRSKVVTDAQMATLRKAIVETVDVRNSELDTDELHAYKQIGTEFTNHQWVDH